jgi:hypothetical protein
MWKRVLQKKRKSTGNLEGSAANHSVLKTRLEIMYSSSVGMGRDLN